MRKNFFEKSCQKNWMIKQKGIIFAPLSLLERGEEKTRDHWNNKRETIVQNGIHCKRCIKNVSTSHVSLNRAKENLEVVGIE